MSIVSHTAWKRQAGLNLHDKASLLRCAPEAVFGILSPLSSLLFCSSHFPFTCSVSGLFHLCLPASLPVCLPAAYLLPVFLSVLSSGILAFCLSVLSGGCPTCVSQLLPPTLPAYLMFACFLHGCSIWRLFQCNGVSQCSLLFVCLPPLCLFVCCLPGLPTRALSRALSFFLPPSLPPRPLCLVYLSRACPFLSTCFVWGMSRPHSPASRISFPFFPSPDSRLHLRCPSIKILASSGLRPEWELQVPAAHKASADVGGAEGRGLTAAD